MSKEQRRFPRVSGEPSSSKQKCFLWDPVEKRHDKDVRAKTSCFFVIVIHVPG